jgi:hypothetical protein
LIDADEFDTIRDELKTYMQKQILKYKSKLTSDQYDGFGRRGDVDSSSLSDCVSSPNSGNSRNRSKDVSNLTHNFI